MIKSTAVAQLKQLLGYRTDLLTLAPAALQIAQEWLQDEWPHEDEYPWFLKTEVSTTSTTASDNRVGLPDDWLADWEHGGLSVVNSEGIEIELEKNDYDSLKKIYATYDPTFPSAYAIDGIYYRLFPTPDAAYSIKQIYYQKDADLSDLEDSAQNLWLKHAPWALIGKAAVDLGGPGISKTVQFALGKMNDSIEHIYRRSIWMHETNRRPAMGETF